MRAWSGERSEDVMGATVNRSESPKNSAAPPLKNGSDLRASGYLIAVGSRTARFRRNYKNRYFIISTCLIFTFVITILTLLGSILIAKLMISKNPNKICQSPQCLRSAANLATSMKKDVDPCDNFYEYVCGNWLYNHPRPDALNSYDWFRDKQTKMLTTVREFLGKNMSTSPKPVRQAQDMFNACTDTETLNILGLNPINEVLQSLNLPSYPTYIDEAEDVKASSYTFDWLDVVIKVKTMLGMDVLIGFEIYSDAVNSSIYRLVMGSPETVNPFPRMNIDRKRFGGSSVPLTANFYKKPRKTSADPLLLNKKDHPEQNEKSNNESIHATDKIYTAFYEKILKIFVLQFMPTQEHNGSTTDLNNNINRAALTYIDLYHFFSELEFDNTTISDTDTWAKTVPLYTVDELQAITDAKVEMNNGTAVPIWKRYLEGVFAISNVELDFETDKIIISDADLEYLSLLATFVSTTPPVTIELYIWVKVVEVMAVHSTGELMTLFLETYNKLQESGQVETTATRCHLCASAVNDMMGLAVAYAIINPNFLLETRPKIESMINNLKNSFATLVGKAKWMDDTTKLATYEKIAQMKTLIGFPSWLLEDGKLEEHYAGIEIGTKTHLQNMISILQQKMKNGLNRFRTLNNYTWASNPTEVNAYHTFQENTITIPIVILEYPFYDLGLEVLNYGSLGSVLGHEITHGFDDFGRHFDKNGNILPWWTNSTIEAFEKLTICFINQYDNFYVPELQQYVDGYKTLGENIADNGGLREAYFAFKEHERKYGPEQKLPGFQNFSSDQLFFISYTNLWCGTLTLDALKQDLSDEHSPQSLRAIGALQNSNEFANAFQCPTGKYMSPLKRCIIF